MATSNFARMESLKSAAGNERFCRLSYRGEFLKDCGSVSIYFSNWAAENLKFDSDRNYNRLMGGLAVLTRLSGWRIRTENTYIRPAISSFGFQDSMRNVFLLGNVILHFLYVLIAYQQADRVLHMSLENLFSFSCELCLYWSNLVYISYIYLL